MFYLKKQVLNLVILSSFFLLNSCGDNNYNIGHTSAVFKNLPPSAHNIYIVDKNGGVANINDTLNASYRYNDVDGDTEGVSTYRWYRNDSIITGAKHLNYTLSNDDQGQLISFSVIPVATTGTISGAAVVSNNISVTKQHANRISIFNKLATIQVQSIKRSTALY